jgi:uncharacterized protein with PhoU and TrkA domain
MNGMEMMLRNMGLAEVLDAAKSLASAGSVQKIMEFAQQAEGISARLENIERLLRQLVGEQPGDVLQLVAHEPGCADPGCGGCSTVSADGGIRRTG